MSEFIIPLVDLRRQEGSLLEVSRSIPAPEDFSTDLMKAVGDIDLDLTLQSVSEGVLVTGRVDVDVDGQCARCLIDIETSIDADITELYFYAERAQALAESGDEEAEEVPVIVEDQIDIEDLVRDSIVSQMPFIPLCDEDCEGLCATCGQPMSELEEGHAHVEERPRTPLDDLKDKLLAEENK